MFMKFIDKSLDRYLIESLKDEAIGDLWEYHSLLIKKRKSRIYRGVVIIWRSLLLIYASFIIKKNKYKYNNGKIVSKIPRIIFPLLLIVFGLIHLGYYLDIVYSPYELLIN